MITKILQFVRPSLTFFSTLIAMAVASKSGFSQTNGYYVALLRSECTSAPLSPPAVGQVVVGPDYVMMTVAEGDPLDFSAAQRAVTDATFASLMPKYCGLSRTTGTGCVTSRVQWNPKMMALAKCFLFVTPERCRPPGSIVSGSSERVIRC